MTATTSTEFLAFRAVTFPQEVIFASGALAQLDEPIQRYGWQRLMLATTRSMQRMGHVEAIRRALGPRLVAVFDCVQPHVPDVQVEEAVALATETNVDAVIALGGGSAIGMAKAVALRLSVPVIAIPTTYAGSEMTSVFGITYTREIPQRKITRSDAGVVPRLVVYDPELTRDLSPEMTAASGTNALAHCIEALYSRQRHPVSTVAAISGAGHISNALFRCYGQGNDMPARSEMLLGAHLAGFSLAGVTMGLHHGLCHILGGTAGVPHGIANAIILPHAVRFNADAIAELLLPLAGLFTVATHESDPVAAVYALADAIFDLIRRMNLPQRLRDVGVPTTSLPHLAQLAFENHTVRSNPKPIADAGQIEGLLQEAW